MQKNTAILGILVLGIVVVLIFLSTQNNNSVAGYLYTSLNGEGINQVISFERKKNGSIGAQKAFSTDSLGGANTSAGGDAFGDFDSQGAIQIIEDKLLVVNAGGNTVSVFDVNQDNGDLSLLGNTDSQGARPVSIAYQQKTTNPNHYWVVVGNQWNNPNSQKGGPGEAALEQYPHAEFHQTGHLEVLAERNIYLFSFDATTGSLSPERSLDTYPGTNGGPTTVSFNNDGTKLGVTTWGIAHFGTATPTQQQPSRVYVYDFEQNSGTVSGTRFFEEEGIAGSIGFNWDHNVDKLYVSNFNLRTDKHNNGLTVLEDNGSSVVKVSGFGTGNGNDIDEACWTLLNPTGDKLYVSSFGGNILSVFNVSPNGIVSKVGGNSETAYTSRLAGTPPGDTKDMYITPNGKHMYNIGAYQTFTLSQFGIKQDTGELHLKAETPVAAATLRGPGVYNFLGLDGFDKK